MTQTARQSVQPKPSRLTSKHTTNLVATVNDPTTATAFTTEIGRKTNKGGNQAAKANKRRTNKLPTPQAPAAPSSKQALILSLLKSEGGAKLEDLMQATGWQAHSIRGMISGVIKKRLGIVVQTELIQGIRHYRIRTAA